MNLKAMEHKAKNSWAGCTFSTIKKIEVFNKQVEKQFFKFLFLKINFRALRNF